MGKLIKGQVVVSAPAGAPAEEVEEEPAANWRGDLDYPAILRRQQAQAS